MKIGPKLKILRKQKKMTLQEVSEKSGVALATLSRIENGKMIGTLQSHVNIARALEISLPQLYADIEAESKTVDVQKSHTEVFVHKDDVSSKILTSNVLAKKMMPVLYEIAPGATTHKEENKPGVEKFLYVMDGTVEVTAGPHKHELKRGSSLYLDASLPHFCTNTGKKPARCICVTTPPEL